MKSSTGLTEYEERAVHEYVRNGNNRTKAYLAAFPHTREWKYNAVANKASLLFQREEIMGRVEVVAKEMRERIDRKYQINDDRITKEYARIAFFDIRQIFNEDGTIKALHELEDDVAAGLFTMEVNITESIDIESGKKIKTKVTSAKVKAINKIDALRDLGKHIGYFAKDNAQQKPETFTYNNVELPTHIRQGIPAMHDESIR